MKRLETYGEPLAGVRLDDLSGWLIVLEGTDGVGRTTHVDRLRAHLERLGYAVAETGLSRSDLASRGIRRAKQGNTLGSNAFNLFYATDFADRLEQQIVPALKAGAVVLADRYVFIAFARDVARGVSAPWVRALYRFAVRPDGALYGSVVQDGLAQPFLFLLSDHGDAWDAPDCRISADIRSVARRIPGDRLIVTLRGAHHFSFSYQALVKSPLLLRTLRALGIVGSLESEAGLQYTRRYVREFFDVHLRAAAREQFYREPLMSAARFETK